MDIDTRVFDDPIRFPRHQVSSDRNRTLAYYKKKAIMRSEMKDYDLRYNYAPRHVMLTWTVFRDSIMEMQRNMPDVLILMRVRPVEVETFPDNIAGSVEVVKQLSQFVIYG